MSIKTIYGIDLKKGDVIIDPSGGRVKVLTIRQGHKFESTVVVNDTYTLDHYRGIKVEREEKVAYQEGSLALGRNHVWERGYTNWIALGVKPGAFVFSNGIMSDEKFEACREAGTIEVVKGGRA